MLVHFPLVLIVDDDPTIVRSLRVNLEADGFEVLTAATAAGALERLRQKLPDLAVVDLLLPDMHGFDLCRRIKRYLDIPVILLTAVESEDTVVHGLEHYAEDYVVKPFSYRELLARIARVLKRTENQRLQQQVVEIDEHLQVDFAQHLITRGGKQLRLTPIESRLLAVLARNANRVVSVDSLLEEAWPDGEGEPNRLWVNIRRLRSKLEVDPDRPRLLLTERGTGYRLCIRTLQPQGA